MKPQSNKAPPMRRPSDPDEKLAQTEVDLTHGATRSEDLRQPNEHDEAPKRSGDRDASITPPPRQVMEQAASDVAHGLKDTERRGIPSDVPSQHSGESQGGEVPAAGIDRYSTDTRAQQGEKPAATEHTDVRSKDAKH